MRFFCLLLSLIAASAGSAPAQTAAAPDGGAKPDGGAAPEPLPAFAGDDFLLVPLRIHALSSAEEPMLQTRLGDADIRRIVAKVNRVWDAAGVRFVLESIVREPAEQPEPLAAEQLAAGRRLGYLDLRAPDSRSARMLHVYFVHEMDVNGVYLGEGTAFVKDTARLREVEGGIDEPIPRVVSHELGHALGLAHRQDRLNLMASGTTGTSLNAEEIRCARARTAALGFAWSAADVAERAGACQAAGRCVEALALDAELMALPDPSSLRDRARSRFAETARRLIVPLSGALAAR